MSKIRHFYIEETGLEMSEYAVAAALITLACVITIAALSSNIAAVIKNIASYIVIN